LARAAAGTELNATAAAKANAARRRARSFIDLILYHLPEQTPV
jgi:hypothetical protein